MKIKTRTEENAEMRKQIDDLVSERGISPQMLHAITNTYLLDISKSLAIIADKEQDHEKQDDKETLDYYTSRCTSCGKVSPIGDYCIWCGQKGTCFEGGDPYEET